ncbi:MAG: SIS domain-containing protein [candidate division KSB1 bacterium]|nr:SIS domain-containing protein [candidate division KSB1 bacterium]MDZ7335962.1 SIS domain-containing protein [candidate division KSB1 bacterium]MDZ7357928.1 SIS domain-containing protein [candidate division KSB1 bacterium]MDZ7375900.1 SIS domain-containing protein [candidate division KSB1 bacterium]MDZ7402183.1 SIS domain-containing protein [candidate division KSB1 bacterium]
MEMITEYFNRVYAACNSLRLEENQKLIQILEYAYYHNKHVFFFGNGGSGATASHFCEDLGKGTLNGKKDIKRFRTISLTDNTPYILALANDEGYESIFVEQLRNLADPGDVAIGISGSGNSPNVLRAIDYANKHNMITVGMTGFNGGRLKKIAQYCLHIPIDDMGITECVHSIIAHYITDYFREKINQQHHEIDRMATVFEVEVEQHRMLENIKL